MESRGTDFNPNSFSDVPLYNIQAVAAATGVPSITLRSWERRYGVPQPKRDPKGYRLYSDRDIAVTRWLKERVQHGVGISRAVNMLRVLETGVLAPELPATLDFETLRTRLLESVKRLDEAGIGRIIGEALMVGSVEEVCLRLLQPTLYAIGQQWAEGGVSVTSEHVGSNLIRSHVFQLVRLAPAPLREETVLVGCAPGEQHDVGALMLALFLRRRGFDVIFAGANVEEESFIADAYKLEAVAVCLSASSPGSATALGSLFDHMQGSYTGLLGFGGLIFQEQDELVERIRGTYLGPEAETATRNLETVLAK